MKEKNLKDCCQITKTRPFLKGKLKGWEEMNKPDAIFVLYLFPLTLKVSRSHLFECQRQQITSKIEERIFFFLFPKGLLFCFFLSFYLFYL